MDVSEGSRFAVARRAGRLGLPSHLEEGDQGSSRRRDPTGPHPAPELSDRLIDRAPGRSAGGVTPLGQSKVRPTPVDRIEGAIWGPDTASEVSSVMSKVNGNACGPT